MSKSKAILNLLDSLRSRPACAGHVARSDWYRVPAGGLVRLETCVDRCEGGSLVLSLEATRNRKERVEVLRIEHHDVCHAGPGDAEPAAHCGRSGQPAGRPLLRSDWLTLDPGGEIRASLAAQSPGTEVRLAMTWLCITWE